MSPESRSAFSAPRDRGDELVLVQLLTLAGGADEAVAGAAGVLGHHRAARGDVHRHPALGHVVDRGALGAVVLAVEVDAVTQPQLAHQLHRLAKAREPLLELRPLALVAGGDLVERLSGADAEEDAVRVQARHRRERLRDHRRVVAERRCQHRGAQLECLRALTDGGHPCQGERRVAALVPPRLEVVADRGAVHAVRLGGHGQFDELARRELLRRRLVAQFQSMFGFSHAFVSTLLLRLAGWRRR